MSPGPIQLDQATALTLMLGPNGSVGIQASAVPSSQPLALTGRKRQGRDPRRPFECCRRQQRLFARQNLDAQEPFRVVFTEQRRRFPFVCGDAHQSSSA